MTKKNQDALACVLVICLLLSAVAYSAASKQGNMRLVSQQEMREEPSRAIKSASEKSDDDAFGIASEERGYKLRSDTQYPAGFYRPTMTTNDAENQRRLEYFKHHAGLSYRP